MNGPASISALPLLQQLNDWVIKQNEKTVAEMEVSFRSRFRNPDPPKGHSRLGHAV